ncbi:MAG: sigma-54 dependent transcriptional regulator, partial [Peptococcaceae bacterium]|nr:sigma-54 dependent transcriptional regulator [Peptococcaceae bacterium]
EAFRILRLDYPALSIIMMTAFGTVETTLETMRLGAFDYLTKPFDIPDVKQIVEKAMATRHNMGENPLAFAEPPRNAFIGSGPAMQEVFKTIGRVSASDSSVLIEGESGTGKELVARTVHQYSSRKDMPFVSVNCGAVPEGVLESEFFGHEKGSFTGAYTRKIGKFEHATGGTIFLDEIGEMSPLLQVKLLRVLQEREFERVGGNERVKVDVRIIAATNKNLKQSVAAKTFRADLFYRLNVVSITIPPLRERQEDISLLAAHFRDKYCAKLQREPKQIAPATLAMLESYNWPGNVRELENTLEHAIVMGSGRVILPEDLPEDLQTGSEPGESVAREAQATLRETLKAVEKKAIAEALRQTGGNKVHTARLLDISRRALQYKIEEYGLDSGEEGRS